MIAQALKEHILFIFFTFDAYYLPFVQTIALPAHLNSSAFLRFFLSGCVLFVLLDVCLIKMKPYPI